MMPSPTARPGFVHLHNRTAHSKLGISKIAALTQKAAADGSTALAITDTTTLSGVWQFADAARQAGLKPIFGVDAAFATAGPYTDSAAPNMFESGSTHDNLTLLASTSRGWENLIRMVRLSTQVDGAAPLMDYALLKQFGEGLIVLTGGLNGPVGRPAARGYLAEARANLRLIVDAVGAENVYIEVSDHGSKPEKRVLPILVQLSAETGVPLVATNDTYYVDAADQATHDVWMSDRCHRSRPDEYFRLPGSGYHLRTEQEMRALHPEAWWQTAVSNTVTVADRCADVLTTPVAHAPKFQLPTPFTSSDEYLAHVTLENAHRIYGQPLPQPVADRLHRELGEFADRGHADHLLVHVDLAHAARERGIGITMGRGSTAGSLTLFCLGLTEVDPIAHSLLFERFLGTVGRPNIDVNIEQSGRDLMLGYLSTKYGAEHVARAGYSMTRSPRAALRAAAGILGYGHHLSDSAGPEFTEQDFDKMEADATDRQTVNLVQVARGLTGSVTGESIHACAILLADEPLDGLIPLRQDPKAAPIPSVAFWSARDLSAADVPTINILSLNHLDIVSETVRLIKANTGEVVAVDGLPNPNTVGSPRVNAAWDLIGAGRNAGVFQLGTAGISALAARLKPCSLGQVSALITLFRPLSLTKGLDREYLDRKNGITPVSYNQFTTDPAEAMALDTVLGETFGLMLYQEQALRLAELVGGLNPILRNTLRKALGKKDSARLGSLFDAFMAGAGIQLTDPVTGQVTSPAFSAWTAAKVFGYLVESADHLFNASHAFSYAHLTYVTAYLKANWPDEYMAAVTTVAGTTSERALARQAFIDEGTIAE